MGMFDYLTCEVELPDGYNPGSRGFQTKDFENIMTNIKITADGRLEMFFYDFEYVGEYDPGWTKDGAKIPRFNRVNEKWAEYHNHDGTLFTGTFCFYDYMLNEWHEYLAHFVDGQLQEIELVPDRFTERQDQ